jgi:probable DNA repair protein
MPAPWAEVLAALESGTTVVTANERLARNIRRVYDLKQRSAGREAWPTPDILPWAGWLVRLWSSSSRDANSPATTLLGEYAETALWQEIIRESDTGLLPGSERRLAGLVRKAWRACQDWLVDDAEIAATADSVDALTFAGWAAAFRERCRQLGVVDAGRLAAEITGALQAARLDPPRRLTLVGFHEWAPLQRRLLDVIGSRGCDLREQPPPQLRAAPSPLIRTDDELAELDLAARWARRKLELNPDAVVAVVVPDMERRLAAARRAFLDVVEPSWRLQADCKPAANFSYAGPLANVGNVHAAILVLKALSGRIDQQEAGQLLRSPYLPAHRQESDGRARLEIRLRKEAGPTLSLRRLGSLLAPTAPVLAERLQALAGLAVGSRSRLAPREWAERFRQALQVVGWPGDRGLGSDEYQAAQAWQRLLDGLRSCDRVLGTIGLAEAVDLVASRAMDQPFQPAGDAGGVQVLGVLEAAGHEFDAIWICGLTSEDWPPAARPSPLLALELQRRLCMPGSSAPMVREQAERLLRWLEGSAAEVVLSWPAFRGEEALAISPLASPATPIDPSQLEICRTPRRRDSLLASRATEWLESDPAPAVDPRLLPMRGGAALLERQARCPARAFLEFRLAAQELRNPAIGIDASARGAITHAILQLFFHQVVDQEQLKGMTEGEQGLLLDALITRELYGAIDRDDPLSVAIARLEQRRLHALVTSFLAGERERMAFRVAGTERRLGLDLAPAALRRLGIEIRADRIDETSAGRLIIDYKTGRSLPSLKDLVGKRLRSPQLPLYAIAGGADAIAIVGFGANGVEWRGVGASDWRIPGIVEPERIAKGIHADWNALCNDWREALERLATEFLDGAFTLDRWHADDAKGQWAMATRVHELDSDSESDDDE